MIFVVVSLVCLLIKIIPKPRNRNVSILKTLGNGTTSDTSYNGHNDDWSLGDGLASLDSKARIFCEAFFRFSTNSCKPVRVSKSPLLYYPIVKGISAPRQMPASRRVFLRQLTPTRRPVLPYQDGLRTGTQRSRQIQGSS